MQTACFEQGVVVEELVLEQQVSLQIASHRFWVVLQPLKGPVPLSFQIDRLISQNFRLLFFLAFSKSVVLTK